MRPHYKLLLLLLVAFTAGCSNSASVTRPGNHDAGDSVDKFALTVAPASVTLLPNASAAVTLSVINAGSPAILAVTPLPTAVSVTFTPAQTQDLSQLTFTAGGALTPGTYDLTVSATVNGISVRQPLSLVVPVPTHFLLVDRDSSENNDTPDAAPSEGDLLYASTLDSAGVTYNLIRIGSGVDFPSLELLTAHDTVLWYTGSSRSPINALTYGDTSALSAFLSAPGNRKLILVGGGVLADLSEQADGGAGAIVWETPSPLPLVGASLGLDGGMLDVGNDGGFTLMGVAGKVTAGLAFTEAPNAFTSSINVALNPAPGTDVLLSGTFPANALNLPPVAGPYAVATGHTFVAPAGGGTKKVVYVGFSLENLTEAGGNTRPALVKSLLAY